MSIIKHCPNCGNMIRFDDDFCQECGFDLKNKVEFVPHEKKGFFKNLDEKTNFTIILFSFVVFGIFLFLGSIIFSALMTAYNMDLLTYLILTVTTSVFISGIFVGYVGCDDKTYVLPNFITYLGSIYAVILIGFGLIFACLIGFISKLSALFSSSLSPSQTFNSLPTLDLSGFFKIILFVLLIPVAAYIGVYIGYFLKKSI